jgi:CheY-like chemotaxis protein
MLEVQLGAWGMQVDTVPDGDQALERLRATQRETPYALAILDAQMPVIDGLTLVRTIKADANISAIPLILLTTMAHRGDTDDTIRAGTAARLPKPIRQSILHECVLTVLGHTEPGGAQQPIGMQHRATKAQDVYPARILVAEDNVVNQKVAARMLENLGCRADVVANGQEALAASAQIPYACIFMDCLMPEMDGCTATAAIRAREAQTGGHIPIIAMTANAMQGDRERCLEAGMDDYISKPVRSDDLKTALRRWIPQPMHTANPHNDEGAKIWGDAKSDHPDYSMH